MPIDTAFAESRFAADADGPLPADALFDRQWALRLLELTLERLQAEFRAAGKAGDFAVLKPSLVYKARQKSLNRLVALKILAPERERDAAFAQRFAVEAGTLARLNHPGIVTIYDFGQADGLFYFVMEFVDGVSLRQLLGSGRVAPREALAIVPQICDALQYAHDAGIVHRDIKPENILLDRQGRVKVADFGLAKLVSAEGRDDSPRRPAGDQRTAGPAVSAHLLVGTDSTPSLTCLQKDGDAVERVPTNTEAGKVVGTPQYMAPEQTEHPSEVDHRADIYSLGVVFYQMLTGELPAGKTFQPPSSRMRGIVVDVRLDEVVLRALEKEPERRYQQASVLKTRVETILTTPLQAGPRGDWRTRVAVVGVRDGRRVINWPAVALNAVALTAVLALAALAGTAMSDHPFRSLPFLLVWLGILSAIPVAIYLGLTRQPIERLTSLDGHPDPELRHIILVGRRGGKAVLHWPGVLLSFLLALTIAEIAAIETSLILFDRINTLAVLIALWGAIIVIGTGIYRGLTTPVDRLMSLDEPHAVAVPALPRRAVLRQIRAAAIGLLAAAILNIL